MKTCMKFITGQCQTMTCLDAIKLFIYLYSFAGHTQAFQVCNQFVADLTLARLTKSRGKEGGIKGGA